MTPTPSNGAANGARQPAPFAALVIDTDIERNLLQRRALRAAGLFDPVLSAMSLPSAEEIIADAPEGQIALVLLAAELAPRVLPRLGEDIALRCVLVADAEIPDAERPVLLRPVTADEIIAVMARLG